MYNYRTNKTNIKPLIISIIIAFILHLLFLPDLINILSTTGDKKKYTEITLKTLPSNYWKNKSIKKRKALRAKIKKEDAKKKKEALLKKEKTPKGQVVESIPINEVLPDKDSKFLSSHNNKVKKETKSRFQNPDYKVHTNTPQVGANRDSLKKSSSESALQGIAIKGKGKKGEDKLNRITDKKIIEIPKIKPKTALKIKESDDGTLNNKSSSDGLDGKGKKLSIAVSPDSGIEEFKIKGDKGEGDLPDIAMLLPDKIKLSNITGSPAPDHLEDIPDGDGTFLNTREWKHATFFNRIKKSVAPHWKPMWEFRKRDPSGQIYGYKDRVTILNITLNENGEMQNAEIKVSSGLKFLDSVAINAFKKAQPFPNPPNALLDENRKIIFPFGFYLEISSTPGLRLFRY